MADMLVLQFPGSVDRGSIAHGHDVGRAVRQGYAGARKRSLHHRSREVARWMQHMLIRGGDPQAGRVVVSSKMRADASSARYLDQPRQHENRLRRLDHDLHWNIAQRREHVGERAYLFGYCDLWQRHYKMIWQTAVGRFEYPGYEPIKSPDAARLELLVERLDSDSEKL